MKVYGALLSQLELFSLGHGIRMCSLTPGQIKKDFTGMGNSKKDVICDVAIRLGWKNGVLGTMNLHNEADAIALYWVICSRRGIQPSFLAAQQVELDNDIIEVVS
jgi:Holliday junction resolvasome RuvABC endonuclease subunit